MFYKECKTIKNIGNKLKEQIKDYYYEQLLDEFISKKYIKITNNRIAFNKNNKLIKYNRIQFKCFCDNSKNKIKLCVNDDTVKSQDDWFDIEIPTHSMINILMTNNYEKVD